jgi:gliding motility-associated-like protein
VANAGKDTSICYASGAILHGSGGVGYAWTPAAYLNDAGIAEPVVNRALSSIAYILHVTDAAGCGSVHGDTVLLTVFPAPELSAGNDTVITINQPLQLQAVDNNQSGFIRYTWFPDYGLDNAFAQNPVAIIDKDITYQVTAVTAEGCTATDAVKVKVFKSADIYVPNAFTPNGDGNNDVLKITAPGLRKLEYFIVVNRWGQVIFRTSNPLAGWDGTISGKRQESGAYAWAVEAVDNSGKLVRKKGIVMLIR